MMDVADYIGFFITLLALLFLFFHNRFERKNRYENREALEKAEEEVPPPTPLQDFLRALEEAQEKPKRQKIPPQPPRQTTLHRPKKNVQKKPEIPFKNEITSLKRPVPRAVKLLKRLQRPRDMVVYHEIFSKPKGL